MTLEDLKKQGFHAKITEAVALLTRSSDDESYEQRIKKIKTNPIAARVKTADLEDNMDIKRMALLTDKDLERLHKYHESWLLLTQK